MVRVPPAARWAVVVTVLALVYFVAGKVGLSFASVNPSASVIWPPTGIALAACILFGPRVWPAIFVGAVLTNFSTTGLSLTTLGIAIGNTLEGVIGGWLVRHYARGRRAFETPDGVFRYALFAGVLATIISPAFGIASLAYGGFLDPSTWGRVWMTWWLGDVAGALIIAPPLIMLANPERPKWSWPRVVEGTALVAILAVLALAVFGGWIYARLGFLCAPPLLWAAFRFGRRGASLGVVFLSIFAIGGTLRGLGPFAGPDREVSLMTLQAFLTMLSLTALAVAAAVVERRRVESAIRRLNDELEARIAERTAQIEAAVQELRGEVAERIRAEEERRNSEARLLEAQRIANIGSWEWNIQADAVWWSDEMYFTYGVEPGTPITYARFLETVYPEDRQRVQEAIDQAFRDGSPFGFDHRIVRPDGEVRTLHGQGRLVCDEHGQPIRMLGTGQDITERIRAEEERAALTQEQLLRHEAEEANRRKDEFLAILSHELRTPISSITLWAHLLREGALDEPTTRRAIDVIDRNARIQGRLISDILDIARLDTGKLRLHAQPVRLPEAIEAAIDAVQPLADERGVTVTRVVQDRLPEVAGDADRLQQVIWNLLANAVKFAPNGGAVEVRAREIDLQVELEVSDDGPGIDPEFLPHIFDPFRQDDSSSTRRHGGLGLGLAIVKRLVDLHHGTVSARNRTDRSGSIFRVELPGLAPDVDTTASASPAAANGSGTNGTMQNGIRTGVPALRTVGARHTGPPRLSGIQVLVVDDESDARDVLSTALTAYGAEVVTCASAAEAMQALEERPFDVIVSDVAMPGEDGCTFISRVRALASRGAAAIPAVALTAYSNDEYVNRVLEAGFQVHVAKPVEADEIATVVSRLASGVLSPVAGLGSP